MADEDGTSSLELTCFEIIAQVGTAKSCYVNAVKAAKEGDLEKAQSLIDEGDEAYNGGHEVHMGLLQRTAQGEKLEFTILLLHAEDQMASAETCRLMADDFMDVYGRLAKLEAEQASEQA